ncbi:MAG: adenosine kinase, partial [Pseudomonadota bacterium]
IVGIGHALVDVLAPVDASVVERHSLRTGGMHLVDAAAADRLYAEVGPGVTQSGGSVANTMAHLAVDGHASTFVGRVAGDDLGRAFGDDLARLGVDFPAAPAPAAPGPLDDLATGRCVVLVTPGGERTMSTFLGRASTLSPADAASIPDDAGWLIVEGYVFDAPRGPEAIAAAVERAREIGAKIVLTPSDAGCVDRHLAAMQAFVTRPCDVLIGNEEEMRALSGAATPAEALDWAAAHAETACVTLSSAGAMAAQGPLRTAVPAVDGVSVVDTTGAGDAFAAGFVGALARGQDIEAAAAAGCAIAARVITHMGARNH